MSSIEYERKDSLNDADRCRRLATECEKSSKIRTVRSTFLLSPSLRGRSISMDETIVRRKQRQQQQQKQNGPMHHIRQGFNTRKQRKENRNRIQEELHSLVQDPSGTTTTINTLRINGTSAGLLMEETNRIKRSMKIINKRMRRLSKICSKLESQLDLASKALDKERRKLDKIIVTLKELYELKQMVKDQLGLLDDDDPSSKTLSSSRILEQTPNGGDSPSSESSDDEDSYVTAVEISSQNSMSDDKDWAEEEEDDDEEEDNNIIPLSSFTQTCPWTDSLPYMRAGDLKTLNNCESLTWSSTRPKDLLILPSQASQCQSIAQALIHRGLQCIVDYNDMWIPERATERILSTYPMSSGGDTRRWYSVMDKDILLWSGKLDSDMYGSDLPIIKARGLVPCSARQLVDLLMDSSQVKAYNKMSVGRMDEWVIHPGIDSDKGETKVLRSLSKIPLIRKPIEFWTLMHAQRLCDSSFLRYMKGYVVVSRSLWEEEEIVPTMETRGSGIANSTTIRSEVLLSVNLVQDKSDQGGSEFCELTTMNHMYSPCAPSIGAKQLALKAAYNFIRDLQVYYD